MDREGGPPGEPKAGVAQAQVVTNACKLQCKSRNAQQLSAWDEEQKPIYVQLLESEHKCMCCEWRECFSEQAGFKVMNDRPSFMPSLGNATPRQT